jgi:hypothetical protein
MRVLLQELRALLAEDSPLENKLNALLAQEHIPDMLSDFRAIYGTELPDTPPFYLKFGYTRDEKAVEVYVVAVSMKHKGTHYRGFFSEVVAGDNEKAKPAERFSIPVKYWATMKPILPNEVPAQVHARFREVGVHTRFDK